ncbi:F0F1 ATP synthase subunit B [Tundrisphaera sp. TA3]|uniref:F0F1 ATP synthase subunit B n=1 Tax=Tundrisphaera sp. TA3 TaxID=3435775 RepID=UPI003EBA4EF4
MLRNSIPALALLALAIGFGPTARPASAQTPAPTSAAATDTHAAATAGAHADAAAHDGAASHGTPNIMEPQPSLAIYTLIVFGLLMAVLAKFAWKPLLHALHEREAHLEHVLLDSEKARNEAEALAAETRKHLAQAGDQARALIEEARREAKASAEAILREAQAAAEANRARAEREISGAKEQALAEIYGKTADLAVSVAGRVLSRELNADDQRRLVEVALSELPANGDGNGYGGHRA